MRAVDTSVDTVRRTNWTCLGISERIATNEVPMRFALRRAFERSEAESERKSMSDTRTKNMCSK